MTTYLAVFLLLVVADVLFLQNTAIKARRGIFVILATSLLTFQSGLRHESIGGRDVYISYKTHFYRSQEMSWSEVFTNLFSIDALVGSSTEPGYVLFVKMVSSFTDNYQVMIFVMSLIFMIPFGWLVYRYSADPFISFVIYYVIFFSFFSLTGFRQTIATVIAVLLSYPSLTKRRPVRFSVFILMGFLFHRSALIYALIYPVSAVFTSRGHSRWGWAAATVLGGAVTIFSTTGLLGESFGYSYAFENDLGGTQTFVFLMTIVLAAFLLRRKRILESSKYATLNLSAVGLGTIFSLLTLVSQAFMRVQQYFSLLLVLGVPNFISSFAPRDRILVRMAITGVLALLLVRANAHFLFFWEI